MQKSFESNTLRAVCGLFALIAASMLFTTSTARASIELIEGAERAIPGKAFTAELRYDATDRLAMIERNKDADFLYFEGERYERPGPRPNAMAESALLATPGYGEFDASQWRVSAQVESFIDGTPSRGADASAAVTIKPVHMGSLAGIQVLIDPDAVRDASGNLRRAQSLRVSVKGPEAGYLNVPTLTAKEAESSARIAKSTFLNGSSLHKFPARSPEQAYRYGPIIPDPPGDYRITYSDGDRLLRVNAGDIGTSTSAVAEVALHHHGNGLKVMGVLGDDLWFYAPRRVTRYDKTDSAFASVSTPDRDLAPARSRDAFQTLTPQGTEVEMERNRRYDENLYYERLLSTEEERFVYYRAQTGTTHTLQLLVPDQVTSDAIAFHSEIYGYNASSVTPDHYADFDLEGTQTPQISWEGRTLQISDFDLQLPSIPAPGLWTLDHGIPAGSPFASGIDYQNLEAIELTWTGYPRVDNGERGRIDLPDSGDGQPRRITMGGFPAGSTTDDIIILDITSEQSPVRVLNAPTFPDGSGGVAVEFEAPAFSTAFYFEHVDAITSPLVVTPAEVMPDDLPGSGTVLRAIYVRPEMFDAALQTLIDHRGAGNIVELNPQAAYNAYNGGQESPEAIREALRDIVLRHEYRLPLVNVFLVGHASLDPRDYLGTQVEPQVPCFIEYGVTTSFGVLENSVDFTYSLLIGDDDIPDVILGRWPAKSVADVNRAVTRNISHDSLLETLRAQNRPGFFMCDNEDQFRNDQDLWQERWEQSGFPTIRMDNYSTMTLTDSRAQVVAGFTQPGGVTYAQYIGHGNLDLWSDQLMSVSGLNSISSVDTSSQWPIVGVYTCLNGYYAYPGSSTLSMAEAWLFDSDYGAVANVAPCGVDYYFEQRLFALTVIDIWGQPDSTRPRTIGETVTAAQINYATWYPFFKLTNHEYILFGDPQTNTAMDPPIVSGVEEWRLW